VEDEAYVREAIRELVDWAGHGFTVAGEAGNGVEALEAILELRPDVVIADIVMPGMDGIELLRETRKAGIGSRFIMLTAMSDFDYAREALQYGAFNYLLKLSLSDAVLLENLGRIRQELARELQAQSRVLQPLFQRVWADMWEGRRQEAVELEMFAQGGAPSYRRLSLALVAGFSGAGPAQPGELLAAPEELAALQVFYDMGTTTIFCWSFRDEAPALAEGGREKAAVAGKPYGGSAAELAQRWKKVLEPLDLAWYGLGRRGSTGGTSMQQAGAMPPAAEQSEAPRPFPEGRGLKELETEIVRAFEERQETRCMDAAASLWRAMEALHLPHIQVRLTSLRLVRTLVMLSGGKEDHASLWEEDSHAASLAHILRFIPELLRQMSFSGYEMTDHPEVNQLIRYMREHYREEIRVADLARLISMNVDYLSTVFGKKTGLTPIAYLQNIRVEQAKQLLLRSKLSIGQIASETGFADDVYFIRLFKRLTGLTPSAFRKRNRT
jgi:two-component system response regulator YesN